MPGYEVFTLRGGYRVTKDLTVTAAVENLSDEDYRIHGSGVNEPGTNVVLSADWTF
jgi:hemoglobin/transferrin/lactoferrin receptor protein